MVIQEAMSTVKELIQKQKYQYKYFDYYNDGPIDIKKANGLHYTFEIKKPMSEIQISVTFLDKYFDVLAFPHPVIVDKRFVLNVVRFLNYLNGYIKMGNGRFYLDEEFLDVAFSVRVPYYILEAFPAESVENSISGSIAFFIDFARPLYHVSKGSLSVEEACKYVDEIYGH